MFRPTISSREAVLAELGGLISDQLACLFRLVIVIKVHFDSLDRLHQHPVSSKKGLVVQKLQQEEGSTF